MWLQLSTGPPFFFRSNVNITANVNFMSQPCAPWLTYIACSGMPHSKILRTPPRLSNCTSGCFLPWLQIQNCSLGTERSPKWTPTYKPQQDCKEAKMQKLKTETRMMTCEDMWWPLTCLFHADPCWSMHIAWILKPPCEFKVSLHLSAYLSSSWEWPIQSHYAQYVGTDLSCRPSIWKTAFVLKSVSCTTWARQCGLHPRPLGYF